SNGTGAGSAWTAQLGDVETAVSGANLLVKVHFAVTDKDNNVYLLLGNGDIPSSVTDFSGDLTTGWGNLGITSNSSSFNASFVAWGYRDSSAVFNLGGAKTLAMSGSPAAITGTDVKSSIVVANANSNADIWFKVPLSTLGLDSTHNHLKAVVLFGKDTASGGLHSAIPASIDTANYLDIPSVATATLSGL
ncbi:MAG TPA: hypothetical protein VMB23_03895, partial [Spirochaetia bacterium]|nr:hypothetical protein [Spirochaetia bacterium]